MSVCLAKSKVLIVRIPCSNEQFFFDLNPDSFLVNLCIYLSIDVADL